MVLRKLFGVVSGAETGVPFGPTVPFWGRPVPVSWHTREVVWSRTVCGSRRAGVGPPARGGRTQLCVGRSDGRGIPSPSPGSDGAEPRFLGLSAAGASPSVGCRFVPFVRFLIGDFAVLLLSFESLCVLDTSSPSAVGVGKHSHSDSSFLHRAVSGLAEVSVLIEAPPSASQAVLSGRALCLALGGDDSLPAFPPRDVWLCVSPRPPGRWFSGDPGPGEVRAPPADLLVWGGCRRAVFPQLSRFCALSETRWPAGGSASGLSSCRVGLWSHGIVTVAVSQVLPWASPFFL